MNERQRIDEAIQVLKAVGMPKAQLNDRSALCLLALLNIRNNTSWSAAQAPMIGITPIMDWCRDVYNRSYAPNSRETFRRQSMHQFVEAGIALYNPDKPERPVNSPKAIYQVRPEFLALVKHFGSKSWNDELSNYLSSNQTLIQKYARSREQVLVPVSISDDLKLKLSSGEHSLLIKAIIEEFGSRFAPGSKLLYLGDTGSKLSYYDRDFFISLGVDLDSHGKMPDVVLYRKDKNWLYLIESVTSHGPIDNKRYGELETIFSVSSAEIVYITALPSRTYLARFLPTIAWETEVWVSDSPSHLIHFNGDKFMGPYI